jgi:hypothetical protein
MLFHVQGNINPTFYSWFSAGTPASSTTKTDRHDIAEVLLKVALSIINQIKSKRRIGDRLI